MTGELVLPFAEEPESAALELVRRAASGDAAAFDALVVLHHAELVRLARFVLASDFEAEDVVQECWALAWTRLEGLRDATRLLPWLRRSLVRRAIRAARRRRRDRPSETPRPEAAEASAAAEAPGRLDVARALAALAPRQRAVFLLTEIEGWSAVEAAARLGVAAATVRVHRLLARRRLRELFTAREP
jgi:RNA polymerase sigma-70 factor (ECF subfamily)